MTLPLAIPCADAAPAPPFSVPLDRSRLQYGRNPGDVAPDPRLKDSDVRVFDALSYIGRFSHPHVRVSQREVAAASCLTERGVRNCYRRLEEFGYIVREKGYRPAHTCARITFTHGFAGKGNRATSPTVAWPGPSAPMAQPDDAPMAQPDDAPNRNEPDAPNRNDAAPNRNDGSACTRNDGSGQVHKPTLYKGLITERGEKRIAPSPNCSTHYDPLRQRPGIQRLHHHDQLCTDFIARLNAGLEPDFFTYDD